MSPSIPSRFVTAHSRRATERPWLLALLPVAFTPVLVAAFASLEVAPADLTLAELARAVALELPTAAGLVSLGLAVAFVCVACRRAPADATDGWQLLARAAAVERAGHVEAALVLYADLAARHAGERVGHAAQLSHDALKLRSEAGPLARRAQSPDASGTTMQVRLALSKLLAHP